MQPFQTPIATIRSRDATSGILSLLAAMLVAGTSEAQPTGSPAAPTSTESSASDEGGGTTLSALRRARDTLMRIRDFQSALNPAQAAVTEQEQQRDPDYAADLAALARIQGELSNIDAAEAGFLEAIDILAKAEGEYSPTLIDVYRGLGRAYIQAGRYPEAITTLEQAQHISQRNLGLFNVEQAPLLDDITTAYLGLGDTGEARRLQLDRLDNAIRRFGADDPRVIPYRYVLADYFERSRLPDSAREQYEEVLTSQEATLGPSAPALLGPLRQLAKIDLLTTQGENTERRDRLAALLEQNPDAEPLERGLSLASLGDWAIVTGDPVMARAYYQQAWQALQENPKLDVERYFSAPVMLDFVAPLSSVDRGTRSRAYGWAQVVLEFEVSADGLPSGVKIVGNDRPPIQLEERYSRRLRETHFRPRLVAGDPVATSNVKSTHYFRYYAEKERRGRRGEEDEEGADSADSAEDQN